MTGALLSYEVLDCISNRIVNEVPGINRVVLDITSKPPPQLNGNDKHRKKKGRTMATTLEERVTALEAQVAHLLADKPAIKTDTPWWQLRYGAFQDDEIYDEAMRLGAEYRRSQPTAAEEIEALEKAGIHVPLPDGQ